MVTIEEINEQSSAEQIAEASELLREYGRFVLAAEGPARFCFERLEAEAAGLPSYFAERAGAMLLASVEGRAAGCVTWRRLKTVAGGCEMKRLWVRDEFRGLRLGERLVAAVLERARVSYDTVYLDTIPQSMGAAYRMYLRLGFAECPAYYAEAVAGVVCLRRAL